jgi:RNA polymerase sigma-70 factor, ECF subfamily
VNGFAVTQATQPAEERTVEAARAGHAEAWEELFDAHYPKLYRYFRSRLGSPESAEDLAAEVFVEAYRSLGRFRWRNRPFEAWLFGIARHRLLMHYRSRRPAEVLDESAGHVRDEYLSVEIQDVLERLPSDYREAIEYRYVLGLSGEEAAAAMGRSHGAFRTLLSRATRAFKQEYQRED